MNDFYVRYIFPFFLDWSMPKKSMRQKRIKLLKKAQGKVLEIGIGTGLNIELYPKKIKKITAIDINPGMEKFVKNRARKADIEVDFTIANAEHLPFESSTFDTVVSTWTFCSILDINKALEEVYRVLKPDGQLIFIEHGESRNKTIIKWQKRVGKIWEFFGAGCHLDRDIKSILTGQQFVIKDYNEYSIDGVFPLIGYTYQGVGVKE